MATQLTTTEFHTWEHNDIKFMQTLSNPIYIKSVVIGSALGFFVGLVLYKICYLLASM